MTWEWYRYYDSPEELVHVYRTKNGEFVLRYFTILGWETEDAASSLMPLKERFKMALPDEVNAFRITYPTAYQLAMEDEEDLKTYYRPVSKIKRAFHTIFSKG